jgi:hypothetical protein
MKPEQDQLPLLKKLVWLYFWLLIFEGALRKWVVPGLSTPLLIIRDPVVILIYALAIPRRLFPNNAVIHATIVLAFASFMASLAGIGSLKVMLFGLRCNFLHLPLIYVIPRIFDAEDVRKMGQWVLIISIPMAAIVVKQFRSSPDAWINAGAGGELNGQLTAALGKIRPPGLFSFVTGMVSYISLLSAFITWDFLDGKVFRRIIVYAAVPALIISVAVSGSRSAVIGVVIVLVAAGVVALRRGAASLGYLKYAIPIGALCFVMSSLPVFQEGLEVQEARFEGGGGVHEGIVERFVGELVSSFDAISTTPVLGLGLGVGTNAGSGLLNGERQFLLSEGEWGRLILESGPILGIAYLALRFWILYDLCVAGFQSLQRGSSLPLLLIGAIGLDVVTGQFGQPTELGFVALTAGLCLVPPGGPPDDQQSPSPPVVQDRETAGKKIRGRSAYADLLHGGKSKD